MTPKKEIRRYRTHLADEWHSAAIYETLALVERDANRKQVFSELAASERTHARVWAEKLTANGQRATERLSTKKYLMKALVRVFGPRSVPPALAAAEFADRNKYADNSETAKMSAEERHHASVVQALANAGTPEPTKGAGIAEAESWHRRVSYGNDLRAAVLGANDGLVSNFCLIMGVAGAGTEKQSNPADRAGRTYCGLLLDGAPPLSPRNHRMSPRRRADLIASLSPVRLIRS